MSILKKKFLSVATLLSVTLATLSGCSYQRPAWFTAEEERVYDHNYSRALNIAKLFNLHVPETELPKGVSYDKSLLVDGTFNTAMLNVPNQFGATGLTAAGIGFGVAFLGDALKQEEFEEVDSIFGYVPIKKAKTEKEATEYLMKVVSQATIKAIKKLYPEYQIKTYGGPYWRYAKGSFIYDVDQLRYDIELINKKYNCLPLDKRENSFDKKCEISLAFAVPEKQTTLTPVINNSKTPVWKMSADKLWEEDIIKTIDLNLGSDTRSNINKLDLYPEIAKQLPKYTYMYIASTRTKDGKRSAPMILEGNKVMFFIKQPKQNTNK